MLRDAAAVAIGASCGAVGRFALSGVVPLLGINVVGAFLMGWLRPGVFWGRGVLGGFTSFSTFAFLTTGLPLPVAAGYVVATLVGCVGAWWAGDLLRRRT